MKMKRKAAPTPSGEGGAVKKRQKRKAAVASRCFFSGGVIEPTISEESEGLRPPADASAGDTDPETGVLNHHLFVTDNDV